MHKPFPVQLTQNMLCPFCEINKFLIPLLQTIYHN